MIGLRRAKQMAFFGDMLSAQEALSFGLVNEVVPVDQLDSLTGSWGRRLADGPTTAFSLIKQMLDESGGITFEQAAEDEARAQHVALTPSGKVIKPEVRARVEAGRR